MNTPTEGGSKPSLPSPRLLLPPENLVQEGCPQQQRQVLGLTQLCQGREVLKVACQQQLHLGKLQL
jgi:hypothetical protein